MTVSTSNLLEQLLTTLHIGIIKITRGRYGQSTVPNHKLVILFVAHLLYPIIWRTVEQIFLEGVLICHRWSVKHLKNAVGYTLFGTIGIVWIKNTGGRRTVLLDVADYLRILALSLGPSCSSIKPVTVGTGYIGNIPDSVRTGTILQRTTCHGIGKAL